MKIKTKLKEKDWKDMKESSEATIKTLEKQLLIEYELKNVAEEKLKKWAKENKK